MYRLEVEGLVPSLNKIYASRHFGYRVKMKNEWRELWGWAINQAKLPKFKRIAVQVQEIRGPRRRQRDIDNTILAAKFLLDALKEHGKIEDDGPEFVHSIMLLSPLKGNIDKTVAMIYECPTAPRPPEHDQQPDKAEIPADANGW